VIKPHRRLNKSLGVKLQPKQPAIKLLKNPETTRATLARVDHLRILQQFYLFAGSG
jgi:hypothetical protein